MSLFLSLTFIQLASSTSFLCRSALVLSLLNLAPHGIIGVIFGKFKPLVVVFNHEFLQLKCLRDGSLQTAFLTMLAVTDVLLRPLGERGANSN